MMIETFAIAWSQSYGAWLIQETAMTKPLDQWDRFENGNLMTLGMVGGGAVAVSNGLIVARVEYAFSQRHAAAIRRSTSEPATLQLALTLEQVDAMIETLTAQATKIRETMSATGRPN